MPIPTSTEAVEPTSNRGSLAVRIQTSIHIGPTTAPCIHVPVTLKAKILWNVLPSASWGHVGETTYVDLGHTSPLMIGERRMHRVVERRFGKSVQHLGDGSPHSACWRWNTEGRRQIVPLTDDDKTLTGLRKPIVGTVVEMRKETVVRQHLSDLTDELPTPLLTEHRHVLEKEETRRQLGHKPGELEYQAVASVAPVGSALLLREALAGRTAGKEIDPGPTDVVRDRFACEVLDSSLLNCVAHASAVALHGRGIGVEGVADSKPGLLQAEAQSAGTTESVHRNEAHPRCLPIVARHRNRTATDQFLKLVSHARAGKRPVLATYVTNAENPGRRLPGSLDEESELTPKTDRETSAGRPRRAVQSR